MKKTNIKWYFFLIVPLAIYIYINWFPALRTNASSEVKDLLGAKFKILETSHIVRANGWTFYVISPHIIDYYLPNIIREIPPETIVTVTKAYRVHGDGIGGIDLYGTLLLPDGKIIANMALFDLSVFYKEGNPGFILNDYMKPLNISEKIIVRDDRSAVPASNEKSNSIADSIN